ncbi:hypothetical protein EV188_102786 [Actinomycetospora succinea]|uniref:Uncharacterized protein n=1 Tax=Actinomycetospora succinea TaxID=663603 RepID=A0A4R6VMG2_9PSEU|nr:hypothetical protein [Actinomycetospora succinea]TDQ63129.1 hypothetical protein EV188_102786 [Actinomycetospora succinea]
MSRHRAASARAATPTPAPTARAGTAVLTGGQRATDLAAAMPRQGLTEAHPSGPLPRAGRERPARRAPRDAALDADTAALDLAAIALAAASAGPAGSLPTGPAHPASGPITGPSAADPTTGGTPRPAFPAAVPSALAPVTPSHAVPAVGRGGGRRVPLPTRTAGALALVGALAGGGVAVVGGNAVMTADPTPTTGEFRTGDVANAAESGAAAAQLPAPADEPREQQGGRHRAEDSASYDSGGY